jgi:hypothetical protein
VSVFQEHIGTAVPRPFTVPGTGVTAEFHFVADFSGGFSQACFAFSKSSRV